MKNLMTDNIKHLEEELSPLFARIRKFKSPAKDRDTKKGLNLIVKRIKELPNYSEDELKVFVKELNTIHKNTEKELIALVENLKKSSKKSELQIKNRVKALKYQPERSKKEKLDFCNLLKCFPEQTDKEFSVILEYIKVSKKAMEKEVNLKIRNSHKLPFHIDENANNFYKYLENIGVSEQTQNGLVNFIKRTSLITYLNFLDNIKHFERETQEQLIAVTDIIRMHIPKCSMIVLFGSYARGTEVIFDETTDKNGTRHLYQSDFDIMVVLSKPSTVGNAREIEGRICSDIKAEYNDLFLGKRCPPLQFVVECENSLCQNLEKQQPFFSDIIKDGLFLHNDGLISLPEPKELTYKIKKELAQDYFDYSIYHADIFLKYGKLGFENGDYIPTSFQVHQACEKCYRNLCMSFVNYNPKEHNLEDLIKRTADFSPELATVFPRSTKFEDKTFKLLRDAYIDSRYNLDFVVTKNELKYMIERAEILKEITGRICKERIDYYDMMAKNE